MKELDRRTVGFDRLLSDRIDFILKKIEKQAKVQLITSVQQRNC